MVQRNFDGIVPDSTALSPESTALIAAASQAFETVGTEYAACRFRNGLQETLKLAQAANKYLDERAPWKAVKQDRGHAGETLATTLTVINALKTLLHPVLPFSTERLHELLAQPGSIAAQGWSLTPVAGGTKLPTPAPLYTKLDPPGDEANA
jgi:methionyl-tRNA synthetase